MSGKKISVFRSFRVLLPIVYKTSPIVFIIIQIMAIMQAFSWTAVTLYNQRFFDTAGRLVLKQASLLDVILSLLLFVIANFVCQILNGISNLIPDLFSMKSKGKLSRMIQNKISRINPIDFEKTDKLDHINKAELGKDNAVMFVIYFCFIFTFYIPYFMSMAWYLFTLKPFLSLLIVIIFIPTMLTHILRIKIFDKLEDISAPIRRENEYYENAIAGMEYIKETRLLGAYGFFKKLYLQNMISLNKATFKSNLKSTLCELSMKLITILGYVVILLILVNSVMDRSISIGAFAAVYSTVALLFSVMEEIVCRHIGNITTNIGTIHNFIIFLQLDEQKGKAQPISFEHGISLKNVTFTYPTKDIPAIQNININIKPKETIAIVGENGSGKSTLVRLITGLYLPDDGDVLYGNLNTRSIKQEFLFADTTAVFQKFQHYQMPLRQNITISAGDCEISDSQLEELCHLSDISHKDKEFPDGYDTMLSREFGGVEVSGGKWQKIAIARGLARKHELIVLDEPTAAIDPIEETKVYKQFIKTSKNKLAFIVTHRIGTAKFADRILVLKLGKLVEFGTHEQLLQNNGEYERLYRTQQQWYKN